MKRGKCKGCGKPIWWITTVAGKKMPCDETPVSYWKLDKAAGKVVLPNGCVVSCELTGIPGTETGKGFIPHFATCEKVQEIRQKRAEEAQKTDKQLSLF